MAEWEKELLAALEKEEGLMNDLLAQAQRKAVALRDGDITELDAVVNREQPLLLQLQAAQQKRVRVLAAHGLDGDDVRAAVGRTGGAAREPLLDSWDRLRGAAQQLQKLNTKSNAIVQARLEQYDAVARHLLPPKTLYTHRGQAPEAPAGKMLIDRKI